MMSVFAVLATTASRPTGTIIAPPAPWRTRIATSSPRLTLDAQSSEARVKMTIALRKTFLVPSRATIQPLSGINTAKVIK